MLNIFNKLLLIILLNFPLLSKTQTGICPIGFVWGGLCGFGTPCQPSLPPFHCLLGSCCRDQRPLIARLGPIIYPQDLIGFGGGGNGIGFAPGIGGGIGGGFGGFPGIGGRPGIGGIGGGLCFDTALNCVSFVAYCVVPIYRICMITRCARTCGVCRGGFIGNQIGGAQGIGGIGRIGGNQGIGGFASPGIGGIINQGIGGFGGQGIGGLINPGIGGFGSPGLGGLINPGIGGFGGQGLGGLINPGIGGFGGQGGFINPGIGRIFGGTNGIGIPNFNVIGGLNGLNGLNGLGGIG